MQPLKPIFGVIGAVFPVIYCGYLLYDLLDQAGSLEQAKASSLGPTLLGLVVVGLFFFIIFAIKLVLIFTTLRSRRPGGSDAPTDDDGFDADAVVARYMAQRPADDAPRSPAAPSPRGPARRSSFGRKIG